MTSSEEKMYIAASAKAQIQMAERALGDAIQNIKTLACDARHKRALGTTLQLAILAGRAMTKVSAALVVYFDRGFPEPGEEG